MKCKICNSESAPFYKGKVLNKYDVAYFKCNTCGFIQTEEPYWLNEAYSDAIATLDIGLIGRNIELSATTEKVISGFFGNAKQFLDYGGGYGMFVRLMRDKGFSFYRYDTHCKNLFAQHFDLSDIEAKTFDLVTAFEVFEHLVNPIDEVKKMLSFALSIFFSTLLAPSTPEEFDKWWYRAPLSGQHIAFFTLESLNFIAGQFNKKLYSNNHNLHLITDHDIDSKLFTATITQRKKSIAEKISGRFFSESAPASRKSLIEEDYAFIENKFIKEGK